MSTKLFKLSFLSLLLLGLTMGCSKSKKVDQGSNNNNGATLKTTDDPNKSVVSFTQGTPTCNKFFYLVHLANKMHLGKSAVDPMERLTKSTHVFASNVLNKEYDLGVADFGDQKIKDNDCSVFENLAKKTLTNKKIADYYGEKTDEFDSLEYIFENILDIYTSSLDMFSDFDGNRYGESGYSASLRSGLRVLDRADYHDVYDSKWKLVKESRKPPYLYVLYSPKYLANVVPKYSRIYKVNDTDVKNVSFNRSLRNITGNKSDRLLLSKWDPINKKYDDAKEIEVEFKNQHAREIDFEIVSEKPKIGYLRIATFNKKELDSDLFKSLIDYLKNYSGKLDGTIIDLRSNLGGSLYETDKIIGTILPDSESIVSRRIIMKSNGEFEPVTDTTYEAFLINFGKIVVLTDFKTASASEMLVAALQDYSAIVSVGETSIGKGIGQRGFNVDEDHLQGELHVTNFYIFSPSGRTWYLDGLQPDIEVLEKANDGFRFHLSDKKDVLPPKFGQKVSVKDFDPSSSTVQNRLDQPTLEKLKTFRNDASQEPKECGTFPIIDEKGNPIEEKSCIYEWGFKILQKWIELEPIPKS